MLLGSGTHGWGLKGHDKGLYTASVEMRKKGCPGVFFCGTVFKVLLILPGPGFSSSLISSIISDTLCMPYNPDQPLKNQLLLSFKSAYSNVSPVKHF